MRVNSTLNWNLTEYQFNFFSLYDIPCTECSPSHTSLTKCFVIFQNFCMRIKAWCVTKRCENLFWCSFKVIYYLPPEILVCPLFHYHPYRTYWMRFWSHEVVLQILTDSFYKLGDLKLIFDYNALFLKARYLQKDVVSKTLAHYLENNGSLEVTRLSK